MKTTTQPLATLKFKVRAFCDCACPGWYARLRQQNPDIKVTWRETRFGRLALLARTSTVVLHFDQFPESVREHTILEPEVGHLALLRALRDAGLVLPAEPIKRQQPAATAEA